MKVAKFILLVILIVCVVTSAICGLSVMVISNHMKDPSAQSGGVWMSEDGTMTITTDEQLNSRLEVKTDGEAKVYEWNDVEGNSVSIEEENSADNVLMPLELWQCEDVIRRSDRFTATVEKSELFNLEAGTQIKFVRTVAGENVFSKKYSQAAAIGGVFFWIGVGSAIGLAVIWFIEELTRKTNK